jgi:glucarate dehydratase
VRAAVCETFQLGVAVHSPGEARHPACDDAPPRGGALNLTFAADAHYHHLVDDVVQKAAASRTSVALIRVPTARGSASRSTVSGWRATRLFEELRAAIRTTATPVVRAGSRSCPIDFADPAVSVTPPLHDRQRRFGGDPLRGVSR